MAGGAERERVQAENRSWWNRNPMAYDWHDTMQADPGTAAYFDEIDRRFYESSPFYDTPFPFEFFTPSSLLNGADVLEIGCGLGSHAELIAGAGGRLTAIDLTPTAIENTTRRLALRGLDANVRLMDAEHLEFPDASFDLVWSWGVIHHSSDPDAILAQMLRVLRPGGQVRLMIYHQHSFFAWYSWIRGLLSGKVFKGWSSAQIVSHYTDGFIARSSTPAAFASILRRAGFEEPECWVSGQKGEILPLPGGGPLGSVKRMLTSAIPDAVARWLLARWGYFLCASARKPHSD